ncbi:MAG TPA: c-type cytochrome [Kofleriaceae bacterium]|nr:c-type cytochrome [Kofleriaceae bacterium]
MRRSTRKVVLAIGIASLTISATAAAKRMMSDFEFSGSTVAFQVNGRPIGGSKPASATAAYLAGSRIAATDDGALVIDADSGQLIRTDKAGKQVASLAIGKNAGLLTYDPVGKMAYVADRVGNRVVSVKVGEKLEVAKEMKTPAEPFGIALSPDRKTLMVTTIADRTLVAFDASGGKEKWRTALSKEPRGLAVSPDGTRALVTYLTTGTVDQVDLLETHRTEHIALSTSQGAGRRSRFNQQAPDSFARGSFTALFMGEHQAIVPFQRETPVQQIGGGERTGSYGGGFDPPITHQLAFLATNGERTAQITAQIGQHQPRALAWDSAHDALYVAGLGSDSILQVKNASQGTIAMGTEVNLAQKDRCGPDGIAVGADGNLMVWCAFTRSIKRVEVIDGKGELAASAKTTDGPELVASAMSEKEHQGYVLFHAAQPAVSQRGALACASCHPDNRADGLSWRIDKQELQTPLLMGRIVGTHPYKWDGGDKDLTASLTSTMKRLGGRGLDKVQTEALAAYLEALPKPVTPTQDTTKVARGEKLFDSAELGCRTCHDGSSFTDQDKHKFTSVTLPEADTPSLIGVAASAPYYHDGSAATLESLLRDRARVHGMAETAKLTDSQVADLVAFLESL